MNWNRILRECAVIAIGMIVIGVSIAVVCKLVGTEPNYGGGLVGGFMGGVGAGRVLGGWSAKEKYEAQDKT